MTTGMLQTPLLLQPFPVNAYGAAVFSNSLNQGFLHSCCCCQGTKTMCPTAAAAAAA